MSKLRIKNYTPSQIVERLDNYIIGQDQAKKAVAIAIRNRMRRLKLSKEMQNEISPKNILMIGPTGVGKTEIARRLSDMLNAPFIKIEATKYTEVGYIGRNVESMIRSLAANAYNMIKEKKQKAVEKQAKDIAEKRIIDKLFPMPKNHDNIEFENIDGDLIPTEDEPADILKLREKHVDDFYKGKYDDKYIEIDSGKTASPMEMASVGVITNTSDLDEINMNIKDMIDNVFSKKDKKRKLKVNEAVKHITQMEIEKLLDTVEIAEEAVQLTENSGIVFIDEIDKIACSSGNSKGPNVSREGVQRDILPIVEGTTVKTRIGNVNTDHILFIGAGAFHMSKPSDLIPELQGRFPIRVELNSLSKKEFYKILTEPKSSLLKQYEQLMSAEKVELIFEDNAIERIAELTDDVNKKTDDIGARRLHSVLEKLLEDISFNADKNKGKKIIITADFVDKTLKDIAEDIDLSRYIL